MQTSLVKKNYNEAFRDLYVFRKGEKLGGPRSRLRIFKSLISKKLKFNGNTQIS